MSQCTIYRGFYTVSSDQKGIQFYNIQIEERECENDEQFTYVSELKNGFLIKNEDQNSLVVKSNEKTFHFLISVENQDVYCIDRCSLEPAKGVCRGNITRFYYDEISGECLPFSWGGCDGIVPFETLKECQSKCDE